MELTVDHALQKGIVAYEEGKLPDAERFFRAVLQAQPNHPDANHNLGVLAVAVGKPLEAIPLFKLAVQANPKIEQFWLSYIDALIKAELFNEAKRYWPLESDLVFLQRNWLLFKSNCRSAYRGMPIKLQGNRHYRKSEKGLPRKRKVTREKLKAHHHLQSRHKIKAITF